MAISDLGDTLLSCLDGNIDLTNLLLFVKKDIHDITLAEIISNDNTAIIVTCFKASAYLYRKAGDHKSYSFQNIKLLYFIKNILQTQSISKAIETKFLEGSIEEISKESIKGIYSAYEHIHTYEINRFKKILNENADTIFYPPNIFLNRISLNTEIAEIVILNQEIKILISKDIDPTNEVNITVNRLVNPYNLISSMYVRFLNLRLKGMANQKQLGLLFKNRFILDEFPDYPKILLYFTEYFANSRVQKTYDFEFLIKDSIFCNNEILKILYTFGYSYFINHSLIAETHENLYYWCKFYISYLKLIDYLNHEIIPQEIRTGQVLNTIVFVNEVDRIKEFKRNLIDEIKKSNITNELGALIEPDNLPFIMPAYQCEKAISEYYAAVESHSQGRSYKNLIENMNYLNDDFNDRLYHFSIALERFNLNRDIIVEKIKRLKIERQSSSIYESSNYL